LKGEQKMSLRFGEILGKAVPLSHVEVEEVLTEQRSTGRRFGEAALELGLCTPEDVWQAWATQLQDGERQVDLNVIGVDAQAVASLPAQLAIEFGVLPIRQVGQVLVLAVTPEGLIRARKELPRWVKLDLRFVVAHPDDIARAIEVCYLPLQAQC
jgi:hypothetical protein